MAGMEKSVTTRSRATPPRGISKARAPEDAATAAIRAVFEQEGELSAAVELRRRFAGITDNARAREIVRMIARWQPLPSQRAQTGLT
jgi:hypothetical protein